MDEQNMLKKWVMFSFLLLVSHMANAACEGLYNHQFKTLQGETFDLCAHKDKAILVVNTASKCGFTPQFEKLEGMYKQYQNKGLLVIGFPSNDFRQEPKSNKEIGDFCKMTYAVNFPMMSKTTVTGANANPFYKELNNTTKEAPSWNFYKYLILPNSGGVYAFSSDVEPNSPMIMAKLKPYLK
jgi:glutathione peroxidase